MYNACSCRRKIIPVEAGITFLVRKEVSSRKDCVGDLGPRKGGREVFVGDNRNRMPPGERVEIGKRHALSTGDTAPSGKLRGLVEHGLPAERAFFS